jgi:hypothetical protein
VRDGRQRTNIGNVAALDPTDLIVVQTKASRHANFQLNSPRDELTAKEVAAGVPGESLPDPQGANRVTTRATETGRDGDDARTPKRAS